MNQLHRLHQVLFVHAEGGAAPDQLDVGHRCQRAQRGTDEAHTIAPVDARPRVREQPAAEFVLLVDEQGLAAGPAGLQGCEQTAGATADHQNVDMVVQVVVVVGVGQSGGRAEACELADHCLIRRPPGPWPLERLAVEACRHEARGGAEQRLQIEVERRPTRGGVRDEAVEQLRLRGLHVGHGASAFAHLDQRVRLLGAGADDAARTAVLEAACDPLDAVREQRRGERIARVGTVFAAVEVEAQAARRIDPRTRHRDTQAAHGRTSDRYTRLPAASVQLPATS